jgi:phosphoribosylformimino-5-aminoimidazole carboxamide ribotide isomerase
MVHLGVTEVLYTDIERDGMLTGLDLETLGDLAALNISVIASGGVSSIEDVRSLLNLGSPRITGVIVGKALYDKRVKLKDLLELTRQDA